MFDSLFASKAEKALKAVVERGDELELHYRGGESLTVSLMLKIYRDSIVLLGFYAKLRSKDITVKVLKNGVTFDTVVKRAGTDKNGNALFYCDLPTKLNRPGKPVEKYRIISEKGNPRDNGTAKVLFSTNRGEKSLLMPIWDVSEYGLSLLNDTGVEIKIGTKLFQAMVTVGTMASQLTNMQVAKVRSENYQGKTRHVLNCVFTSPPRALSEMLSQAKGLAPKPKPKPK